MTRTRLVQGLWLVLALISMWTFAWTLVYTRAFAENPPPRVAEGLERLQWSAEYFFWYSAIFLFIYYISYFAVSLLIILLRPTDRMAVFSSVFLLGLGTASAYVPAPEFASIWSTAPAFYTLPYLLNNLLAWPLFVAFLGLYPDGRFVPRWIVFVALFGFLISIAWAIFPQEFGAPTGWFAVGVALAVTIVFGASLYAQVWRYRHHSNALQQQQTKWLVFGLVLIFLVTVPQQILGAIVVNSETAPATSVAMNLFFTATGTVFVLLPLSIGIAILRYRLWDIDILIRKTLTYAIVVVLLAIVYFGGVVLLQQMFANLTGLQGNELITVISTLAIAALFVPLRNRIQNFIDRRFYRKKYDAQKVLQKFSETVRDETDLEKLTNELVNVVQETMQPTSVSVWLKKTTDNRHKTKEQ